MSLWDDRRSAGFPIMLCAEHGAATGLRELALPERPSGPAAPTSLTGTGDRATETASAASAACGAPIALKVSGGKKYSSEHHV